MSSQTLQWIVRYLIKWGKWDTDTLETWKKIRGAKFAANIEEEQPIPPNSLAQIVKEESRDNVLLTQDSKNGTSLTMHAPRQLFHFISRALNMEIDVEKHPLVQGWVEDRSAPTLASNQ